MQTASEGNRDPEEDSDSTNKNEEQPEQIQSNSVDDQIKPGVQTQPTTDDTQP